MNCLMCNFRQAADQKARGLAPRGAARTKVEAALLCKGRAGKCNDLWNLPQPTGQWVFDGPRHFVASGQSTEPAHGIGQQVSAMNPCGIVVLEAGYTVYGGSRVASQGPRATSAAAAGSRVSAARQGEPKARHAAINDVPPQPALHGARQQVVSTVKLDVKTPCWYGVLG